MTINIDDSAVKRIDELRTQHEKPDLMLRITIDGGGCSGFQYNRELTDIIKDDDKVFEHCIVTDDLSLTFLKDSTVSFKDDLIGSDFFIDNPNAVAGCGCGTSFAV